MSEAWAALLGAAIGAVVTLVVTGINVWQAETRWEKDRAAEEDRWARQRGADEARWRADRDAEEQRWQREHRYERERSREQAWAEDRKRVYMQAATAAQRWRELLGTILVLRQYSEAAPGTTPRDPPASMNGAAEAAAALSSAVSELAIIAKPDLIRAAHDLSLQLSIADGFVSEPVFGLDAATAALRDTDTPYDHFIVKIRRDLGIDDSGDAPEV